MKQTIYILIGVSMLLAACRSVPKCEMKHTGEVKVTNLTGENVRIYLNNTLIFTLDNGTTRDTALFVDKYNIRAVGNSNNADPSHIRDYPINIEECETTEITITYDN